MEALRENLVLEYPEIATIDVVEPDHMFVKVSRKFFPETAKGL